MLDKGRTARTTDRIVGPDSTYLDTLAALLFLKTDFQLTDFRFLPCPGLVKRVLHSKHSFISISLLERWLLEGLRTFILSMVQNQYPTPGKQVAELN